MADIRFSYEASSGNIWGLGHLKYPVEMMKYLMMKLYMRILIELLDTYSLE